MARSRNSSSRRAPAPAPRRQAPPPAPRQAAPAPAPVQQQQSGGMMSGLLGTVASGMAFGTGSAIAHRAVGAVANSISGSSEAPVYEAAPAAAPTASPAGQDFCSNDQKSFFDCLNANRNDISACQYYLDQFDRCKQQSMSI